MLALIAATSLETQTLRRQLVATSPLPGGFPLFHGRIGEQDVLLAHSGIGKANAAACATALLCRHQPRALVNFGCGGAYPDCGLEKGDLALAESDSLFDEGSDSPEGFLNFEQIGLPLLRGEAGTFFNRLPTDASLHSWASRSLRDWSDREGIGFSAGPFLTVSTCTGRDQQGHQRQSMSGAICENMEGAAIALVAARFSCPLLELRGISNHATRRDTSQWDIPTACLHAGQALIHLLHNWPRS